MICTYCGNDLPDNTAFCNRCGQRQNSSNNTSNSPTHASSGNPIMNQSSGYGQISSGPMPYEQEIPSSYSNPINPYSNSGLSDTYGVPTNYGYVPPPPPPSTELSAPDWAGKPVYATSQKKAGKRSGFVVAGIGGILGIASFFIMPYISILFFSFTGEQLASIGQQVSQLYTVIPNSSIQSANDLQLLWILPAVAGLITLIALFRMFSSKASNHRAAASFISLIALIALVALIGGLVYLQSHIPPTTTVSITSFIGLGIWAYMLAMLIAFIGGLMQFKSK